MSTVALILGLWLGSGVLFVASIVAAAEIERWRVRRAESAEVVAAAVALLQDAAR